MENLKDLSLMALYDLKRLAEEEIEQRFKAAEERMANGISEIESNVGFEIFSRKLSKNADHQIVIAKKYCPHTRSGFEYVTWRRYLDGNGKAFFEHGNYFFHQNEALADFKTRE